MATEFGAFFDPEFNPEFDSALFGDLIDFDGNAGAAETVAPVEPTIGLDAINQLSDPIAGEEPASSLEGVTVSHEGTGQDTVSQETEIVATEEAASSAEAATTSEDALSEHSDPVGNHFPSNYDEHVRHFTTSKPTISDQEALADPHLWVAPNDLWLERAQYNLQTGRLVILKTGGLAFAKSHYPHHPTGIYKYIPINSPDCESDATSYHEGHDLSTHSLINLPLPCAFIDEPRMQFNIPDGPVEYMIDEDSTPTLSPNGKILRKFDILPRFVSTQVEGWRLHYWFTMDPRIQYTDIIARMRYKCDNAGGEGPLAGGIASVTADLKWRVQQFREHCAIFEPMTRPFNRDTYQITPEECTAIGKLTMTQLEYGVWWTVDETRGVMYPPKPDNPAIQYNYDFYLLPVKQGLSPRIKFLLEHASCAAPHPVQLLDPTMTALLQIANPIQVKDFSVPSVEETMPSTPYKPMLTPATTPSRKGVHKVASTGNPTKVKKASTPRKRGRTTVTDTGSPAKRAKTGPSPAAAVAPPPPPGPIAQLFGAASPPSQRRAMQQAVLTSRRSVEECLKLQFSELTNDEKARLLLPLINGQHPMDAEREERMKGAEYGAMRQREALAKAARLRQQAMMD